MDTEFKPLKSNLRILLAKNKMNMTQLAKQSSVSRYRISDLQDEIAPTTKLITLMKLAKALNVEWLDLIDQNETDSKD